jgi:hypothetical protein
MAGGLFPGKPFEFNVKCIVFTALVAGGYWVAPPKNKAVLGFLLWAPYIAMAYYDYLYDCRNRLQPTPLPFGRTLFLPFKPADYQARYAALTPEQKAVMDRVDRSTAHVLGWTLVAAVAYMALRRTQ